MNPLKPGKNVHFYVRRRLNQTLFLSLSLSLSLEKKKNQISIPHNFTLYPIIQIQTSFGPDVFRLPLKLQPNKVIQLDDSTRHARLSPISSTVLKSATTPGITLPERKKQFDARGESANTTTRRES